MRGPIGPQAQADGLLGARALGEEGGHGAAQDLGRRALGGVQKDRQTVAGAQDEDAVDISDGAQQVGPEVREDAAQAGDCLQALGAVVGGEKMNSHSGR